jgi:hypothetical protein
MAIVQNIVDDLTTDKLSIKEVLKRIKDTVDENQDIHGITVAYKPYAYNPKIRLCAP